MPRGKDPLRELRRLINEIPHYTDDDILYLVGKLHAAADEVGVLVHGETDESKRTN